MKLLKINFESERMLKSKIDYIDAEYFIKNEE